MQIGEHTIECVTFDLDDTLWECYPVIIRAEQVFYEWLSQIYPRIARDFTVESLMAHRRQAFTAFPDMSHDFTWLRKRWLTQLILEYDCDESMADEGFEVFLTARNTVTLFDGVESMLQKVNERYRCGSITNGNADIALVGLKPYFDFEITASGAGAAKPDPIVFRAAISAAAVAPEKILHVGDDPERDIRGATQLGMHTAWINPDGQNWQGEDVPTFELKKVTDMVQLLESR
ncbi:MAG: HAD-IA family hydrolase [Acidiferrobacterales bacterium]|nr:HAD-IA family hydrolase [Acidiferrobacterales bacterium]